MATFRGLDGSVSFATNTVAELTGWTLNIAAEELDDTAMGDSFRSSKGGLVKWNGTLVGHLDYGDTNGQKAILDELMVANPAGASVAMVFIVDTGKSFAGNATVLSIDIDTSIDGIVGITVSFSGAGSLLPTWA